MHLLPQVSHAGPRGARPRQEQRVEPTSHSLEIQVVVADGLLHGVLDHGAVSCDGTRRAGDPVPRLQVRIAARKPSRAIAELTVLAEVRVSVRFGEGDCLRLRDGRREHGAAPKFAPRGGTSGGIGTLDLPRLTALNSAALSTA